MDTILCPNVPKDIRDDYGPLSEITGDVRRAIVGEAVRDPGILESRSIKRQLQLLRDIVRLHCRAELPIDGVAQEIDEDRREIKRGSADDLEVRVVGLPELVRTLSKNSACSTPDPLLKLRRRMS